MLADKVHKVKSPQNFTNFTNLSTLKTYLSLHIKEILQMFPEQEIQL